MVDPRRSYPGTTRSAQTERYIHPPPRRSSQLLQLIVRLGPLRSIIRNATIIHPGSMHTLPAGTTTRKTIRTPTRSHHARPTALSPPGDPCGHREPTNTQHKHGTKEHINRTNSKEQTYTPADRGYPSTRTWKTYQTQDTIRPDTCISNTATFTPPPPTGRRLLVALLRNAGELNGPHNPNPHTRTRTHNPTSGHTATPTHRRGNN